MCVLNQKSRELVEKLAKGSPPPSGSIRASFQFYEKNQTKARKMQALWETILLWSGYNGFYTVSEIATIMQSKRQTIRNRIKRFKRLYPEAYEKILTDRKAIGKAATRQFEALANPDQYKTSMDKYIKEKF